MEVVKNKLSMKRRGFRIWRFLPVSMIDLSIGEEYCRDGVFDDHRKWYIDKGRKPSMFRKTKCILFVIISLFP
jgi:hypothetical protein